MWHPTRRYTTAFYLVMLIIVFSVAVAKQHVAIVIILLLIEMCAGFWYGISYIPFGRKMFCTAARQVPCLQPCFQAKDHMFPPKTMSDRAGQAMDKVTGGNKQQSKEDGVTMLKLMMIKYNNNNTNIEKKLSIKYQELYY